MRGLWHDVDTTEKAAVFSSCGKGVGSILADASPKEGLEWKMATRREETKNGNRQRNPGRKRIHNRVRHIS